MGVRISLCLRISPTCIVKQSDFARFLVGKMLWTYPLDLI